MANLWPLMSCDVSKCGIGNPADEISNEKVFRPTSDYDILRVHRDELKARLKTIKCNVFVDKTEMEFYKKYPYINHPLAQAVEENCNYILQEVYKKAAVEMAEFIIKSDFIECETVETEHGTEYRFRLTVWAEPKED